MAEDLEDLMLPSGSTVRLTPDPSLRTQLANLGIAQAHIRPRNAIILDYWKMVRQIHDAAGHAAVDAWLWQHR
jgi:hypothetical protein